MFLGCPVAVVEEEMRSALSRQSRFALIKFAEELPLKKLGKCLIVFVCMCLAEADLFTSSIIHLAIRALVESGRTLCAQCNEDTFSLLTPNGGVRGSCGEGTVGSDVEVT